MKLILAYLPPDHVQDVIDALSAHHVADVVLSAARSVGQEHAKGRGGQRDVLGISMARQVRLELACADEEAEAVVEAISESAHTAVTHRPGLVMVLPVDHLTRIGSRAHHAGGAADAGRREEGGE